MRELGKASLEGAVVRALAHSGIEIAHKKKEEAEAETGMIHTLYFKDNNKDPLYSLIRGCQNAKKNTALRRGSTTGNANDKRVSTTRGGTFIICRLQKFVNNNFSPCWYFPAKKKKKLKPEPKFE